MTSPTSPASMPTQAEPDPQAAPDDLRVSADLGRFTIAKSFELTARSITAFAAGVGDFNPVYFEDDRPGGLLAHPGMVFSWQWNSRFTPDVELPLALVRRGVHAWVDVRFNRHPREGDVITCQGQSIAVKQVPPGVLSTQRYTMRDSRGKPVAIMDTGGITRGARLDSQDLELDSQDLGLDSQDLGLDSQDPELDAAPPLPQPAPADAQPVWSSTVAIDPQAPHVYTECADIWNPIHTERRVALAAGLPDIILHGSANITIALREVINRTLNADPTRVRRFAGRFRGMVIPGTNVTVNVQEIRKEGDQEVICYEMRNHQNEPAITNGIIVAS